MPTELLPDGTAPRDGSAVTVSASAPETIIHPDTNIEQSINLSGGDEPIFGNDEDEPSEEDEADNNGNGNRRKKTMAQKGTSETINYFKERKTKANAGPDDEQYMIQLCEEIRENASSTFHVNPDRTTNNCKVYTKCKCLNILQDENKRWAVAQYFLNHFRKNKFDQDNIVIQWYRAANKRNIAKNQSEYPLPFDANGCPELSSAVRKELFNHELCRSAMLVLLQKKTGYMRSIRNYALTTGVAKEHGNKGKPNNMFKPTDEVMVDLTSFFKDLEKMGKSICVTSKDEEGEEC